MDAALGLLLMFQRGFVGVRRVFGSRCVGSWGRWLSGGAEGVGAAAGKGVESGFEGDGGDGRDVRRSILDAALPHVEELGWSTEALSAGAEEAGYSRAAHGMFSEGGFALVLHAMDLSTERVALRFVELEEEGALGELGATERVKEGLVARLESIAPFVRQGVWARAMAMGLLPQHALQTTQRLGHCADEIWHQAGDISTDSSWYTRRALLLSILVSTELHMLTDDSVAFSDSWEFLDRSLDNIANSSSLVSSSTSLLSSLATGSVALLGGVNAVARPFLDLQKGAIPFPTTPSSPQSILNSIAAAPNLIQSLQSIIQNAAKNTPNHPQNHTQPPPPPQSPPPPQEEAKEGKVEADRA